MIIRTDWAANFAPTEEFILSRGVRKHAPEQGTTRNRRYARCRPSSLNVTQSNILLASRRRSHPSSTSLRMWWSTQQRCECTLFWFRTKYPHHGVQSVHTDPPINSFRNNRDWQVASHSRSRRFPRSASSTSLHGYSFGPLSHPFARRDSGSRRKGRGRRRSSCGGT